MLCALHPDYHRCRDCASDPEAVGDGEEAARREEEEVDNDEALKDFLVV